MAYRADELKQRTKRFALRVIRLYQALPKTEEARVIGKQLLRSGTSVGANYRSVCRSRSTAEFVARLGIVIDEADESAFWLELLEEAKIAVGGEVTAIQREAGELVRIFGASQSTARRRPEMKK